MSLITVTTLLISSLITSTVARPTRSDQPKNSTCEFPPPGSVASSISWIDCDDSLGVPVKLQCANYSVPIDWDEPNGEHFNLGLVRHLAPSNSTSKIGTLFLNPGGPGGSTVGLVAKTGAGLLDPRLVDAFDLIGLDPRGVGLSSQVKCDMSIFVERVSMFPQTQEDYDKLVDKNKRLGASCRNLTGPLVEHVDTISVVKDHEAVRIALGDVPFNFVGLSYGTQIGSQYADLFPDNIRTMVLDGLVAHSQAQTSNLISESFGYTTALKNFLKWASTNETSALKGRDAEKVWADVLAQAAKTPIPAKSCNGTDCAKDVSDEDILFIVQGYLVPATSNPLGWVALASGLFNASQGDASAFATSFTDLITVTGFTVGCIDWPHSSSFAEVQRKEILMQDFSPLTRGATQFWSYQQGCIGWPAPIKNPPKKMDVKTEATILLVNSDADPESGFPFGLNVADEIENYSFVTRKGDGHTSFSLVGGETSKIEVDYLLSGKAPKDGLITHS